MKPDIHERSEALLLRAWIEGQPLGGLRVKITRIRPRGEVAVTITTTVETTCTVVETWLRELGTPPPSR